MIYIAECVITVQGHPKFLYNWRLPISDQQQPWPYLSQFQRYGVLLVENRCFLIHFCL